MFSWKQPSSNVWVLLLLFGFFSIGLANKHNRKESKIYQHDTIILYFGAFDHDAYLKTQSLKYLTPAGQLAKMATGFPTTTVAVQFSVSTGVYAKDHGVYYDPFLDFKTRRWITKDEEAFYKQKNVEPIWIVNELAGGKSACINWLGAEFVFSFVKCTYLRKYQPRAELADMIPLALEYILEKKDHPNLILLYYDKSREIGEDFGPHSAEFHDEISKIEKAIKYFYNQLTSLKRFNSTNLLVVGDSGLIPFHYSDNYSYGVEWEALMKAEKEVNTFQVQSPLARFITYNEKNPDEPNLEWVDKVKNAAFGNITTLKAAPIYWWTDSNVWGDLILMTPPGSFFHDIHEKMQRWKKKYQKDEVDLGHEFGLSGYSNAYGKMKGLFWGVGPDFEPTSEIEDIDVTDIKKYIIHNMGLGPGPGPNPFNKSELTSGQEDDNLKLGFLTRTILVLNVNLFVWLVN